MISHKRTIFRTDETLSEVEDLLPFSDIDNGFWRNFLYHRQDSSHSNFTRVEDLLLDSHSDCPERLGPAGTSKLLVAVIVNRILPVTLHPEETLWQNS